MAPFLWRKAHKTPTWAVQQDWCAAETAWRLEGKVCNGETC